MAKGFSKQIQDRISNANYGAVFVNSDFADIAESETIRRNLNILTQAGILRRILKGIYEKPKYSKLLDEYVAVSPGRCSKSIGTKLSLDYCTMWKYSS